MSSEVRLLLVAARPCAFDLYPASGDDHRGHRCGDLVVDDGGVFAASQLIKPVLPGRNIPPYALDMLLHVEPCCVSITAHDRLVNKPMLGRIQAYPQRIVNRVVL